MSLTLLHMRFQLLQSVRIPIALIGTVFFPAASMLFFVVPAAGRDPVGATYATASMVIFATMTTSLFRYGIGVAEDRARPWEPYTRTLPVGPWPRFCGRLLAGLVMTLLSMVPVVVIAAVATEARVSLAQLAAAGGVVVVTLVPFTLLGLTVGYLLPTKAALATVQILFLPLAFAAGLFSGPDRAPSFVEKIAPYLPSRGAVELMWAAVGGFRVNPTSLVALAVWTAAMTAAAVFAYGRDEVRRFD